MDQSLSVNASTSDRETAGEIISFHVFGKVIVVLNSVKATKELFEKRGEIYSDRPIVPIHEMYTLSRLTFVAWSLIKFRMKWEWLVPFTRLTQVSR